MNINIDNTRVLHSYHPLPSLPPRWKEQISDIQEAIIPPKRDRKGGKK